MFYFYSFGDNEINVECGTCERVIKIPNKYIKEDCDEKRIILNTPIQCPCSNTQNIIYKNPSPKSKARITKINKDKSIKCPRCGSTQYHADKRGWSMWTGFIGARTVYITCLSCGKRWKPGS